MKSEGDEGDKASRLVLQSSQPDQMIHLIFRGLDVAIQHGAIAFQADLVRDARGLQPLIAVDLVIANDAPDALGKDLGAATGQGIDTGLFQTFKRLAERKFGSFRQVCNLDHSEGL